MTADKKEVPCLPIQWKKFPGVVLFADLAGFFPIARQMNLGQLGDFMQTFYGFCYAEVVRQKGEVVAFVGDAVFGLFRTESCEGMDPEWCATLTAFHLVKRLRRLNPDLNLNIGINSGELLEGRWEMNDRPSRTILGDTVNRAAILAGGKLQGNHVTKGVIDVLGPRVTHEKSAVKFPGGKTEEAIFRLLSLDL